MQQVPAKNNVPSLGGSPYDARVEKGQTLHDLCQEERCVKIDAAPLQRSPCAGCRRKRYAAACALSAVSKTVSRYQEWAVPYRPGARVQNDLFMRVTAAVGVTLLKFMGTQMHVLKPVGREQLEGPPLLQGVHCDCVRLLHAGCHQTRTKNCTKAVGSNKHGGSSSHACKTHSLEKERMRQKRREETKCLQHHGIESCSMDAPTMLAYNSGQMKRLKKQTCMKACKLEVNEYGQPRGNGVGQCGRPRRYRGGGFEQATELAHDAEDTFMAILTSYFRDRQQLDRLLEQNWVPEWGGWVELRGPLLSDDECSALAQRFLAVAETNQPQGSKSNQARIAELQAQGLELVIASPHGENNCLIDTLLLGLVHLQVLQIPTDIDTRRGICAACRVFLETEYGTPKGAFLDALTEAPRILGYFTNTRWQRSVNLKVQIYDRFDHAGLGLAPQDALNVFTFDGSKLHQPVAFHDMHIFCHTAAAGSGGGYHFDLLWPRNEGASTGVAEMEPESNTSPANVSTNPCATGQCPDAQVEPMGSVASENQPVNLERSNHSSTRGSVSKSADEETVVLTGTVAQPAPAATLKHVKPVATVDAATAVGGQQLGACLQNFLNSRSETPITIGEADVTLLRTKWNNMAKVGAQLQVWLGASLPSFEPTQKNAHLLAKQWMRYYTTYTQGPGRVPGGTEPENNSTQKRPHEQVNELERRQASPDAKASAAAQRHGAAQAPGKDRPVPARSPPKKRYRKKGPQDPPGRAHAPEKLESDEYWLGTWKQQHGNLDPRARKEEAVQDLASLLRPRPLLPRNFDVAGPAVDLPTWHCAFQDCEYESETSAALEQHLLCRHVAALRTVTDLRQPPLPWEDAGIEAYKAALTVACQRGAPTAHAAVDRRCLREFQTAKDADNVGAAICFVCARRFPHMETGVRRAQDRIMWRRVLGPEKDECLGTARAHVEHWLGRDVYWERYGRQHGSDAQAELEKELLHWQTTLYFESAAPLRIVCCPEDKVCARRCAASVTCPKCRAPVCEFCWTSMTRKHAQPATALANDMLIFFAPKMIYQQEVTFMELVCASPCFTAMCCFSLEKKLLGDRALDQDAFMPRQRLAARGNATTFPLAWEDMLQHLETATSQAAAGSLRLPRVGVELAETVSVIIKTMETSRDKQALSQVIHQARVRRAVVLELLFEAQRRGHPAYKHVDWAEALSRAEDLPEDGVPEEIVTLLPHDEDLSNVLRQKAATPARGAMSLEAVAEELGPMCKPNAVVNEKSSAGMGDVNAQQVAALEATRTQNDTAPLQSEITLITGNRVLDQFQPWYFAFAFAYVFPFSTGMPDPPAWSKNARYRRPDSAPRVDLETWMRCMARRCEAQVNRDWVFGFASWNLFFRSSVNLSYNVQAYSAPVYDETKKQYRTLTAQDIEEGAVHLVRALSGQYIDVNGKPRAVNGDVSKLQYVRNLTPAARKLLGNMRHTARRLPGTQEARRQMRFEIEAMRIRYGVPLFVTFSPDESHQLLYIRMARTRAADPVRAASVWQECLDGRLCCYLDGRLVLDRNKLSILSQVCWRT